MPLASSLILATAVCVVVWIVCWHANKTNIRVMDQNARMTSAVLSLAKDSAAHALSAQIEATTGSAISADVNRLNLNGDEQLAALERSFPTGL